MDSRVAKACTYRFILRATRQEKCHREEKKRDSTYINLLKGSASQVVVKTWYLETLDLHCFFPQILTSVF